jgi:ABC-type multidrug transport system fused ATPase/permease subunit
MSWSENNEWLQPDKHVRIPWHVVVRFLRTYRAALPQLSVAVLVILLGASYPIAMRSGLIAMSRGFTYASEHLYLVGLLAVAGSQLLLALSAFVGRSLTLRISTRVNAQTAVRYYEHMLGVSVEDYLAFRRRANLFQRVLDAMSVTSQFTEILLRIVQSSLLAVAYFLLLALTSRSAFGIAVLGAAVLWLITMTQSPKVRKRRTAVLAANYPLIERMTEVIEAITLIKTLGASAKVTKDVEQLVRQRTEAEYREGLGDAALSGGTQVLASVVTACILLLVGIAAMRTGRSAFDVLLVYFLTTSALPTIVDLALAQQSLVSISGNLANYFEVLDLPLEDEAAVTAPKAVRASGEYALALAVPAIAGASLEIDRAALTSGRWDQREFPGASAPHEFARHVSDILRVDHVSYKYAEATNMVLDSVSFSLAAQEHVCLIGRSGAGKSTILRLLLGLLRPECGDVYVRGRPLSAADSLAGWRRQFSMVSQNDYFFATSLRENLHYGLEQAPSDDELEDALGRVGLLSQVRALSSGLSTRFSRTSFSGGELQRFCIARALVRNPAVVLLDEPTSALDFESERKVLDAVAVLTETRTILTVAHRLSTVQRADRVLVLEGGRIAASGSHSDLLSTNEYYRSLCTFNSFLL